MRPGREIGWIICWKKWCLIYARTPLKFLFRKNPLLDNTAIQDSLIVIEHLRQEFTMRKNCFATEYSFSEKYFFSGVECRISNKLITENLMEELFLFLTVIETAYTSTVKSAYFDFKAYVIIKSAFYNKLEFTKKLIEFYDSIYPLSIYEIRVLLLKNFIYHNNLVAIDFINVRFDQKKKILKTATKMNSNTVFTYYYKKFKNELEFSFLLDIIRSAIEFNNEYVFKRLLTKQFVKKCINKECRYYFDKPWKETNALTFLHTCTRINKPVREMMIEKLKMHQDFIDSNDMKIYVGGTSNKNTTNPSNTLHSRKAKVKSRSKN